MPLTPDTYKQQMEQAAAQVPTVVVCQRPDQVAWTRLPAAIADQLQRAACAHCGTELVWSPRSSPAEPLKLCEPCGRTWLAQQAQHGPVQQALYLGPERAPLPSDGQHRNAGG